MNSLNQANKAHHHSFTSMGCAFVITAVESDPQRAWDAIRRAVDEITRIENLISSWKNDSQTAMVNKMSGLAAVKVDEELFELIRRSIKVSDLTSGCFDISGTLSRFYWDFNKSDGKKLPDEKIEQLRSLINYKNIELNDFDKSIYLKKKGMKIGFGGIGKGYAAQCAMNVMKDMGINSGLVNASGDLLCWGNPPNKDHWEVKIPNTKMRHESLLSFTLPYGAVVTSGNHEHFTLIDDQVCSHIIDPRTAYPVTQIKQVSVVSPNAEFADAMATAISVMGIEEGLNMVDRLNGIECVIVDSNDHVYYSAHFEKMFLKRAA